MITHIIFKLKHDIGNDSELQLAALELESIFGMEVEPVRNLVDTLLRIQPLRFSIVRNSSSRIQDILLRLPYPGAIQAYHSHAIPKGFSIADIERLTYFRDVFIVFSGPPRQVFNDLNIRCNHSHISEVQALSPLGHRLSPTVSLHKLDPKAESYILRVILAHCFLECSDHVVRLAHKLQDVDRMYDGMISHLQSNFSRAFAASVQMGFKWIEDFIDDRRPPNAYASHSLFGLRGRFFPRMVRALVSHLICKTHSPCIVDPFCGVGTLGIECAIMGLHSKSYDISPFFVRVSKAKHHALILTEREVSELEELREFSQELRNEESRSVIGVSQDSLFQEEIIPIEITIPPTLSRGINKEALQLLGRLRGKISKTCSGENAPVALLAIAYYAKSMLKKYTKEKILRSFWGHLSRTIYLDRFMKRLYNDKILVPPVSSKFEVRDVRRLSKSTSDVMAMLTSPPYTTAIDYVANDVFGYYALGFEDHPEVERDMIGSTKLGHVSSEPSNTWPSCVPSIAKERHKRVERFNAKKALCLAKYFFDMTLAMQEIAKVLVPGGRMAMIVCSEQEFGASRHIRYPVAESIVEIGMKAGFKLDRRIDIDLTKNSAGDIMQDSALIFYR